MKKHHKIIIGSVSSIMIIILIANSVLLYVLFAKLQYNYNQIENDIENLQADTQSKLNELTEAVTNTQSSLSSINKSIKLEINELKASVDSDFSGIVEEAVKSVVTIRTDISQGTGFIIDEEGYVVTNYHVVKGASAAVIINSNSKQYAVELIGTNELFDIALLKIDGSFEAITLANSNDIQVGEKVIAIGNPLGLQFSVSEGIVSALDREGANGIEAYIQTDAALNPGNSGGPLINKQGKVIGINNFKVGGGESLGFALESNYIKDVVNDISMRALEKSLL